VTPGGTIAMVVKSTLRSKSSRIANRNISVKSSSKDASIVCER
jgi:hypothetical protein